MIRNKFIAAQQSCELRRHLDGASSDASIQDIVDSCRVWESHTEAVNSWNGGPDPKFPQAIYQVAEDTQPPVVSTESETLDEVMRQLLPTPAVSPPRASDHELLIQRLLGAVRPAQSVIQERSKGTDIELMLQSMLPVGSVTEVDVPPPVPCPEGKLGPLSAVPLGPDMGIDPPVWGWARVYFSCGHQGHGVNRCSQMDTSFPFLSPGWSVDVRNGRYRASRTHVDGLNYTPGKEGWSGREGQPPGIIGDRGATDPGGRRRVLEGRQPAWQEQVGRVRGSHWTPNTQVFSAPGGPLHNGLQTA